MKLQELSNRVARARALEAELEELNRLAKKFAYDSTPTKLTLDLGETEPFKLEGEGINNARKLPDWHPLKELLFEAMASAPKTKPKTYSFEIDGVIGLYVVAKMIDIKRDEYNKLIKEL